MHKAAFQLQLPKSWATKVRSAMLHVVSLAKYAAGFTRSWTSRMWSAVGGLPGLSLGVAFFAVWATSASRTQRRNDW